MFLHDGDVDDPEPRAEPDQKENDGGADTRLAQGLGVEGRRGMQERLL
jgi:hypothetical protein